ncbi:amidase [Salinisphaera sp. S4-8]|uniref:amidase n=1 Tax=Salinisphaera sp. S4-8 TaxID=633357 RepID=UPI00334066F3
MQIDDYIRLTATDMLARLARREVSATTLADCALQRIEQVDDRLNAFCHIDERATRDAAAAADERYRSGQPMGRIDGLPVAVKDAFDMIGWPTRDGSKLTGSQAKTFDAPTVAACRRHGFVPAGKTTTPEFGWKAVTDSPLTGITRNPWNTNMTCGGSSGGSAAAVAAGVTPVALGADTGGSIRIPASFCGAVGFKPSHGHAPTLPGSHHDKLTERGPITRTVQDAATLIDVITESDPSTPQHGGDESRSDRAMAGDIRGLRIAFSPALGFDVDVDPQIAAALEHCADLLASHGARVVRTDPPIHPDTGSLRDSYHQLFFTETAVMARNWSAAQIETLDAPLQPMVKRYLQASAADYLAADSERVALMQRMSDFHRDYDLVLCPTAPVLPFEAGREVPADWPHERWTSWAVFAWPWNMSGQPAITVPCGFGDGERPIGAQFVGARHADHLVMRAGRVLQQTHPLTDRAPRLG